MTPKEKAKEMCDKYNATLFYDIYSSVIKARKAKECALIAVNEILDLGYNPNEKSSYNVYQFYSSVKIEITSM